VFQMITLNKTLTRLM